MTNSTTPASRLRKLHILAIVASVLLIGALLTLSYLGKGSLRQVPGTDNPVNFLYYCLGFWLAAGAVAGVVLGKMNSVVQIINAEGWSRASVVDSLIVTASCTTLRNGYVIQNQIANLFSGAIGVGVVYLICQLVHVATGNLLFAEYPGYALLVIPFVTVWKLVEGWSQYLIMRRHFRLTQALVPARA